MGISILTVIGILYLAWVEWRLTQVEKDNELLKKRVVELLFGKGKS